MNEVTTDADSGEAPTDAFVPWGKRHGIGGDGSISYPLAAHLLDSYAATLALWDGWLAPRLRDLLTDSIAPGQPDLACRWVALAVGLHDVGKATGAFQLQSYAAQQWNRSPAPGTEGGNAVPDWRDSLGARISGSHLEVPDEGVVQMMRDPSRRTSRRHEYVAFTALTGNSIGPDSWPDLAGQWLPTCTSGHHGTWHAPTDPDVPDIADYLCQGGWSDVQQDVITAVCAAAGLDHRAAPSLPADRAATVVMLVTGLTILADWVASSDDVVVPGMKLLATLDPADGPAWVSFRAQEMTALVDRTLGTYQQPADIIASILGSDGKGVALTPRPLQEDAQGVAGGLWLVAYPTGEGKTEAALLRHANRADEGIIFGLPTRATTDAMQSRMEAALGSDGNSVVLSHQFAAAHKVTCSSRYGLDWFATSIRRLVAPVVAATCDQVLAGALKQSHISLRLLALANHHVVLDEVHTYDHYQCELLTDLLAWWGVTGTRVTLLSATLPAWQRRLFVSAYQRTAVAPAQSGPPRYPAHQAFLADGTCTPERTPALSAAQPDLNVAVVTTEDPVGKHAAWAVATYRSHPACRIAVISSTVDRAIATAIELRRRLASDPVDVVCLHSRMTVADRSAREAMLEHAIGKSSTSARPIIVVATQVIEASLDLDFDFMSTDIGPGPSIMQRAGRLWRFRDATMRTSRHGYAPTVRTMHVVVPVDSEGQLTRTTALPYLAPELRRVWDWLRQHPSIAVPRDVQGFVDNTVFDLDAADLNTAAAEVGHALARIGEARRSKAALAAEMLSEHAGYLTLSAMSDRPVLDEMVMATRYIDRVTGTYILLGHCHSRHSVDALAAPRVRLDGVLPHVIAVSGGLDARMRVAYARTVGAAGLAVWAPQTRAMKYLLPVSLGALDEQGMTYDADFGLTVKAP